ncbi:patatin-like phospholipase family protein [Priestia aryabhattai]|uniref:patatin-like phospholipase family protein n=1 Tax=Priestia aryabhattai TaxID=412384 RepID=UPI003A7FEC33
MTSLNVEDLLKKEKLGLALSGGGFRAAFFHLGVLARLADNGILQNVKIISTVSGGSIIGGLYYQELIKAIKKKEEEETPIDYINIVKRVEEKLTEGVKKNIRRKLFLHPIYESISLFQGRERVLGKLYNKFFYNFNINMEDLQNDNECCPKLILNATSLNDGKHWFFTTEKMGQYKSDNVIEYTLLNNKVKLSEAVAASSTVPGLFNFFPFEYTDKNSGENIKLKLVDGGVFDNLGVYALQEEEVDYMIISDASRPLFEENVPRRRLSVLKRSFDTSLVFSRKLLLNTIPQDKSMHINIEGTVSNSLLDEKFSGNLAKIRTDLDKFHTLESNLLSFFGYCMIGEKFKGQPKFKNNYKFQDVTKELENEKKEKYIIGILKSGSTLSRVGGNVLLHAKGWGEKLEGLLELFHKFSFGLIAIIIGIICLINFSVTQELVQKFFGTNNGNLVRTGQIIFIIGLLLFAIHWLRESLGNNFKYFSDIILYKILHSIGVIFLWIIIILTFVFIIIICSSVLNFIVD